MAQSVQFRHAARHDLESIVGMLADDELGSRREDASLPLNRAYAAALEAIDADPNNELVVAVLDERIVGVLQITFIPYLTYQGGWRALIEGVRVASDARSAGVGRAMLEWAIDRAGERGCMMVQLTTDKARPDAIRFYQCLGFSATHEGMKLKL